MCGSGIHERQSALPEQPHKDLSLIRVLKDWQQCWMMRRYFIPEPPMSQTFFRFSNFPRSRSFFLFRASFLRLMISPSLSSFLFFVLSPVSESESLFILSKVQFLKTLGDLLFSFCVLQPCGSCARSPRGHAARVSRRGSNRNVVLKKLQPLLTVCKEHDLNFE